MALCFVKPSTVVGGDTRPGWWWTAREGDGLGRGRPTGREGRGEGGERKGERKRVCGVWEKGKEKADNGGIPDLGS